MITEVQPLHQLLKLINVDEYPKERVERLWEKVSKQDYAFNDVFRGDMEAFLSQFLTPMNLFFEIGDMQGLAMACGIVPGTDAQMHFMLWDTLPIIQVRAAAKSLIDNLFHSYSLHRLSSFIPERNVQAIRLALSLGFQSEGHLREAFLYHGQFLNVKILGLLQRDFEMVKEY